MRNREISWVSHPTSGGVGLRSRQREDAGLEVQEQALALQPAAVPQVQRGETLHEGSPVKHKTKLVCSEARDILGGNGLLLENHVARHLTDLEIVDTYEAPTRFSR